MRDKFGDERRTRIEEAAATPRHRLVGDDREGADHRHPVAARVDPGDEGPCRARRGGGIKWREGDGPFIHFHAQTTDRLALFASNGRAYTLAGDKLPGARGFGEPVRLLIDLEAEVDIVQLLVVRPEMKLLIAASDGRGFVSAARRCLAETRKGKQLVNLRPGAGSRSCAPCPKAPMRSR